MHRRWIIRSLALALLTLCVTAWMGSYWLDVEAEWYIDLDVFRAHLECGRMVIEHDTRAEDYVMPRCTAHIGVHGKPFRFHYGYMRWQFLGFGYDPSRIRFSKGDDNWSAAAPLWFPTLLSALLLWLIWRKTRPKYNGKGFPVEPAAQPTKS